MVTSMSNMVPKQHPPSPTRQVTSSEPVSYLCCCGRRSVKVNPVNGSYPGYDIFEVRPDRHLRVMHLNPRRRDERFQFQMEKYMAAQTKSGKYGTKGKTWELPQPGRMDKVTSFKQYWKTYTNNANGGGFGELYGHHASYQSYHGDGLGPTGHPYKGEDNLSFCAESPDGDQKQVLAGQNGSFLKINKVRPDSKGPESGLEEAGDNVSVKSGNPADIRRVSTATSVQLNVSDEEPVRQQISNGVPHQHHHPTTSAQGRPATPPIGDPAKEQTVIFFIHGVGGSSAVWQSQTDYFLRAGYEVVLPDLMGHGFSSAPLATDAYNFSEIACDLLVIFDLYCKRKNMVVGHSYGSSFATVLARQRSHLVTQLVMVSGGSPTPLAPQPGTFSAPTWLLACCKPILNRGFRRSAFHNKKFHSLMERAFDVPTYVLKYTMNGQNWLEGGEDYHRWITPTTLLIYGRQDKLVLLEEEQEMERIVIGSRLEVIENASHMVMMEQPEIVNHLLHRFLVGKLKMETSPATSETDFRSINNSRASLRSNKSVPSGLVAGNLK